MSVINPLAREISAKIVFYGPGLSGKTTTLSQVHASMHPSRRGDLVTLETEGERTLFFDFLPIRVETKNGMSVRFQLFTVPGQVFYAATRQLVLDGADGVVFVADSQEAAMERNLESLDDLESNLRSSGRSLSTMPFVLQYNKRDLPHVLSLDDLSASLNRYGSPEFETAAQKGVGISEVLRTIMKLVRGHLELEEQKARKRSDSTRKPLLELVEFAGDSPLSKGVIDRLREVTLRPDPAPQEVVEIHANEVEEVVDEDIASEKPATARHRNPLTIPVPAAQDFSFASLFDDPGPMLAIEKAIAEGAYAEAVYRAASAVSEILDAVLGPYGGEGYGARAMLLGLDGREYLELRKVASRAASAVTQKDALFAVYFLLAVRFRERRLTRF